MILTGRLLPITLLLLLAKTLLIGGVWAGCVAVGSWALWCFAGVPVVYVVWRIDYV